MAHRVALAAWLAAAVPALAQGWQEYRDPALGFAVSYPGTPLVSDTRYALADGGSVAARLYDLRQGAGEYRVIVADFSTASLKDDAAIDAAARMLAAAGQATVDLPARVERNRGRQLSVTWPDGTRVVSAIFFVDGHLYQVEGIAHPGASTSDAVRFQQSLNFLHGFGSFDDRR